MQNKSYLVMIQGYTAPNFFTVLSQKSDIPDISLATDNQFTHRLRYLTPSGKIVPMAQLCMSPHSQMQADHPWILHRIAHIIGCISKHNCDHCPTNPAACASWQRLSFHQHKLHMHICRLCHNWDSCRNLQAHKQWQAVVQMLWLGGLHPEPNV